MRIPSTLTILVLVAAAFGFAMFWAPIVGIPGFSFTLLAIMIYLALRSKIAARRWLARASDRPIVLQPPFEGRWRVAAGGPDPGHNHHHSLSDQRYAYDFVPVEGEAWDRPVLAPCAGMIVHVESRQEDAPPRERSRNPKRPFGNYVSIETPRGYVILAHLRAGSVGVRVGERVNAGDLIGRCGNSGNTRGAHLHVHAQNLPSEAIAAAEGVPLAFVDRGATEPMLLEFEDTLG